MANKKDNKISIRSSAAEYLTYIAATGDDPQSFEIRYENENIWLTQKMMSVLYDVDIRTISEHLRNIYSDDELTETATVRNFRIVQNEGTRQVNREILHYNLQAIIAVGFKVNNDRAVRFRKWAGQIVKDHTIQGWTMDKERLKKGHMFTDEYFERQIPMSMEDWAKRLDGFLEFNDNELLTGAGKISALEAKLHAETEFEKYRVIQDRLFISDYDKFLLELEKQIKS